jgi:hypothetical protein
VKKKNLELFEMNNFTLSSSRAAWIMQSAFNLALMPNSPE